MLARCPAMETNCVLRAAPDEMDFEMGALCAHLMVLISIHVVTGFARMLAVLAEVATRNACLSVPTIVLALPFFLPRFLFLFLTLEINVVRVIQLIFSLCPLMRGGVNVAGESV
jgi:hypothetical protein